MDEGHCGLPEDDLLRTGAELLEVPADRLTAALARELQDGAVVDIWPVIPRGPGHHGLA